MGNKYSTDDFSGLTVEERHLGALIAIANEMHNVYTVLYKEQEKKES